MPTSYLRRLDLRSLRDGSKYLGFWTATWLRTVEWTRRALGLLGIKYPRPVFSFTVCDCQYPLELRLGSSDALVLDQIFVQREYAPLDVVTPVPKLIIDCGANVGYSGVYFLEKFPEARLIAVEPGSENLKLCRHNLAHYGERVQIIEGAVWKSAAGLIVSGRGWDTEVREAGDSETPDLFGIDMPSILARVPGQPVDILKVDIERSEIVVFNQTAWQWLDQVRNIAIELHNAECTAAFMEALSSYDFELSTLGELTFCLNIRAKSTPRLKTG